MDLAAALATRLRQATGTAPELDVLIPLHMRNTCAPAELPALPPVAQPPPPLAIAAVLQRYVERILVRTDNAADVLEALQDALVRCCRAACAPSAPAKGANHDGRTHGVHWRCAA